MRNKNLLEIVEIYDNIAIDLYQTVFLCTFDTNISLKIVKKTFLLVCDDDKKNIDIKFFYKILWKSIIEEKNTIGTSGLQNGTESKKDIDVFYSLPIDDKVILLLFLLKNFSFHEISSITGEKEKEIKLKVESSLSLLIPEESSENKDFKDREISKDLVAIFEKEKSNNSEILKELESSELLKTQNAYQQYDQAIERANQFRNHKKKFFIVMISFLLIIVFIALFVFKFINKTEDFTNEMSSNHTNSSSDIIVQSSKISNLESQELPDFHSLESYGYTIDLLPLLNEAEIPLKGSFSLDTITFSNLEGAYGSQMQILFNTTKVLGNFFAVDLKNKDFAENWLKENYSSDGSVDIETVYQNSEFVVFFLKPIDDNTTYLRNSNSLENLYTVILTKGNTYIVPYSIEETVDLESSQISSNNS